MEVTSFIFVTARPRWCAWRFQREFLAATRFPLIRQRLGMLGGLALAGALALFALDQTFHIQEQVLNDLGRDATFTGRTEVWRDLRNAGTPPMLGTGFMSFWDDPHIVPSGRVLILFST